MRDDDVYHRLVAGEQLDVPLSSAEKQKMMREQVKREEESIQRQDYVVYKLKLSRVSQAVATIVTIVMAFNALLYFTSGGIGSSGAGYSMSWLMFLECGVLMLTAGVTVTKTMLVNKLRGSGRMSSPRKRELTFAFSHSLTWFLSALIIGVFSIIVYYVL